MVIVCHFGFFDCIVVDPGPLFAVSLYKTNVRNIASKDLPLHCVLLIAITTSLGRKNPLEGVMFLFFPLTGLIYKLIF